MLRPDKSVMILRLKVNFQTIKILNKNTLFYIEARLNAKIWQFNLLEQSWEKFIRKTY